MSESDKLKKENKQLKTLLRDAVELLDRYKDVLKASGKAGREEEKEGQEKQEERKKK